MKNLFARATSVWILFALLCPLVAPAQNKQASQKCPREFVEGFYRWYIPKTHDEKEDGVDIVLKDRVSDFSPQIIRLLNEDRAAQHACADLVGLDFDPFLASQDPDDRYEVGRITQKGETFLAEIFGVRDNYRREKPDLVAEFTEVGTHWFFVNFHYPHGYDLLSILKPPRPPCGNPRQAGK